MRQISAFLISILLGGVSFSQQSVRQIMRGIWAGLFGLSANSKRTFRRCCFYSTRITHISGNNEGCVGLPQVYGVMGLTENGEGYFDNNLILASEI